MGTSEKVELVASEDSITVPTSNGIGETVEWILIAFARKSINYAVLRNYENLPEIGHDLDLVCLQDQLPAIRRTLGEAQAKFSWECITESDRWSSPVEAFSIVVYKFFDFSRKRYLQLDFFGGFTIASSPCISAGELLRIRVPSGDYYKIAPEHEILFRATQLACAIRDKQYIRQEKLADKIRDLGGPKKLADIYKDLGGLFGLGLNDNIDWWRYPTEFCRIHNKFKRSYFLCSLIKNPLRTLMFFLERVRWRVKLMTWGIPGSIVISNEYQGDAGSPQGLVEVLEAWRSRNIVVDFLCITSTLELAKLLFTAYKIVAKGGLVIVLTPHISVFPRIDQNSLRKTIIRNAGRPLCAQRNG